MWGLGRHRHRAGIGPARTVQAGQTMLSDLRPGQKGKVISFNGNGPIRRRLMDLGIRCGQIIEMVRLAPLNDPLEINLNGGHITIRRSEAALVNVEVLGDIQA